MRMRTALVTARSAPAHERAIRTLMDWNIEVDEAMFLGGLRKGEFLREFEPDFFFDDQSGHIDSARAHVPRGTFRSAWRTCASGASRVSRRRPRPPFLLGFLPQLFPDLLLAPAVAKIATRLPSHCSNLFPQLLQLTRWICRSCRRQAVRRLAAGDLQRAKPQNRSKRR